MEHSEVKVGQFVEIIYSDNLKYFTDRKFQVTSISKDPHDTWGIGLKCFDTFSNIHSDGSISGYYPGKTFQVGHKSLKLYGTGFEHAIKHLYKELDDLEEKMK